MPPSVPLIAEARAVAESTAREAGALVLAGLQTIRDVQHKGPVDLVTDIDLASEKAIRACLLSAFPHHTVIGEEGGSIVGRDGSFRWIVDPLDGTTNYTHGFPFFCVSIALEVSGVLEVGVVYDPLRDERFGATRGNGAELNGHAIHVSSESTLQHALVATGFPYDREHLPRALDAFSTLCRCSQAVRRGGSAALDLSYVACGRLDGYWEYIVRPWDMSAGVVLVREAGGTVTLTDGSPWTPMREQVLSTNGCIHDAFVSALCSAPDR